MMCTNITLPDAVRDALNILRNAGQEAYVVGGCVRDALLGHLPDDWDITTSATPAEMTDIFADYRVLPTGIQHGTMTVLINGLSLEITTFRTEGTYTDGRHPDRVSFSRSLSEDLSRRDFTVNAIAFTQEDGIVDPFGGVDDIKMRRLRCVGNASERFQEDALRILRALRFSSTLSFTIEAQTAQAILQYVPLLQRISPERITAELSKLLMGDGASSVLLEFSPVFSYLFSSIPFDVDDAWERSCQALAVAPFDFSIRLALLHAFCRAPLAAFDGTQQRLRLDKVTRERVRLLLENCKEPINDPLSLKRLIARIGWDAARHQLQFHKAWQLEENDDLIATLDYLLKSGACCTVNALAINGDDLIAAGFPAGAAIGHLLHKALYAVMEERVANHRETLLQYLSNE